MSNKRLEQIKKNTTLKPCPSCVYLKENGDKGEKYAVRDTDYHWLTECAEKAEKLEETLVNFTESHERITTDMKSDYENSVHQIRILTDQLDISQRLHEKEFKKANEFEETLKYIQLQLQIGGHGDRLRIVEAVNKALEGINVEQNN